MNKGFGYHGIDSNAGKPSEGGKYQGSERGGIKGSRKGIKHGNAGRNLHETEHHGRMGHEVGDHSAYPGTGV